VLHRRRRSGGDDLGLLLARAGVEVLVLEKHADFLRDFRSDTIHPSTLEVMHELEILDDLFRLPRQKAPLLRAQFGDLALTVADFSHLVRLLSRFPFLCGIPDRLIGIGIRPESVRRSTSRQ
jgi:2-polyprenyl-6-methoxyphenol hydroxylase-like FAD-dependent oxidoreductase